MPRSPTHYALYVLIGGYAALAVPALPPPAAVACLSALAISLIGIRPARPIAAALGAAGLVWLAAERGERDKLDPRAVGVDIETIVRIVEFPDRVPGQLRFVAAPLGSPELPRRVRLSWYDSEHEPELGECWRVTLRLRRPRGLANPGGFDYEAWLMRTGIGATGYVRATAGEAPCAGDPVARLRRAASERIRATLPDDQATAVLQAITVGARNGISDRQWRRFAATGTSHLMAISGMHIGLAAGACFVLLWALSAALCARGNHRIFAAAGACAAALVYTLMSGFAIPARRALTMLVVTVTALALRRATTASDVLGLAAIAVVVSSPLDLMSPGFKLSFAAVALLVWHARRVAAVRDRSPAQRCRRAVGALVGLQFALLFGLLPLTSGLFGRVAWVAPGVNLLILPLFNFVTVPAALAGLLCAGPAAAAGDLLLKASWWSVRAMLFLIDAIAERPGVEVWVAGWRPAALIAAGAAALWAVLPAGWPLRRMSWVAAAAVCFAAPQRTPRGCVDMHVLDVGQGLAVVVGTRSRTLVYDTGPAFRSGTDSGRLVVLPFLRRLGRARIDVLVVSHGDLDHAGGVSSLLAATTVGAVLSRESGALPERAPTIPCAAGQLWQWDGIQFAVLHPPARSSARGNDASCVLALRAGDHRALLTGDIEKRSEAALLARDMLEPVAVALVPHHGSATSSGPRFVEALSPQLAIVSAGHGNRWGMPREEVTARWHARGAAVINTAESGAVSVRLCASTGIEEVTEHRRNDRRLWRER